MCGFDWILQSPETKRGGKTPHPFAEFLALNSAGQSQELSRVYRRTALSHFKVQVSPRCTARSADFTNLRSPQDDISHLNRALRCVRVTRDEVVPVVDFDHITILRMEVG